MYDMDVTNYEQIYHFISIRKIIFNIEINNFNFKLNKQFLTFWTDCWRHIHCQTHPQDRSHPSWSLNFRQDCLSSNLCFLNMEKQFNLVFKVTSCSICWMEVNFYYLYLCALKNEESLGMLKPFFVCKVSSLTTVWCF